MSGTAGEKDSGNENKNRAENGHKNLIPQQNYREKLKCTIKKKSLKKRKV